MVRRIRSTWLSRVRRGLTAAVATLLVGGSLAAIAPAEPALAFSGSEFMPGLIIADALFYDSAAMTEADIQLFLASKGSGLAGYTFTVASRPAVYSTDTGKLRCQAFQGGTLLPASTIIYRAQVACGISAKVILVTLQKEQGLITKRAPSQSAMDRAMGYACPDTAPCAPTTLGFGNQVYSGALQLNTYKQSRFGRQPGVHSILFNPNSGCGSTQVNIQNYATAALYNYTPYQPNAAALANLGGTGDGCSSYGNRNFWVYYQNWFGSTLGNTPYPVVSPGIVGNSTVGTSLTVRPGVWKGSPSFGYAWVRCSNLPDVFVDGVPDGCVSIPGATTDTYISTADDVGKYVAAAVTGSTSSGSMTAGALLPARVGTPVNTVPPTLSGSAILGSTWSVDIGTWTGTPSPTMAIFWLRCNKPVTSPFTFVPSACVVITGANSTTYVSTAQDVGQYLTAQVAGNSPLGFTLAGPPTTLPVGFPVNTTPPAVSGAPNVGATWTVEIGAWTGTPSPTMAIYWLRCEQPMTSAYTVIPAGCAVIPGARGTTYVSTMADVGKYLTAQVAGNSPLGFALAGPASTTVIQSAKPANVVAPSATGGLTIGSMWTVDVGTWTGSPSPTIAIHWLRCAQPVFSTYTVVPAGCLVIAGATGTTYVATAAEAGKYVTAQVAGNSPIGFTIVGTISAAPIASTKPANTVPPTVAGTAAVGWTWTVNVGTWTGSPAPTMAIHWLRCDMPINTLYSTVPPGCEVIPDAMGLTYVSTSVDAGSYLTAQVAGNSPLGFTIVGAVNTTAVESAKPANTVAPTVSGTPALGSTMTVDVGTWTGAPTPTIAIHWLRCDQAIGASYTVVPVGCVVIRGGTSTTYTPTVDDVGKYLTAQVAGNSPLGFTIVGTVSATPVQSSKPGNLIPPAVSGSPNVGSTLTLTTGTWTGTPAPTIAIHWLRCDQPVTSPYTLVPEGCIVIPGATATTYAPTTADLAKYLTAQVAGNSPLGFTIVGTLNSVATQ
jgi:hypothetical protein